MTQLVDLSEGLYARAKAQDLVVPALLFEQRCNPFARHGQVRGDGHGGVRRLRISKHKRGRN